jgi:hypothetical protein
MKLKLTAFLILTCSIAFAQERNVIEINPKPSITHVAGQTVMVNGNFGLSIALRNKFLFIGNYSAITGGKIPNTLDTSTLIVAGSAGSETYKLRNIQVNKDADDDNLWFTGATPNAVTTASLVGYDYSRTLVKYDNATPYQIRSIGILKDGETLTQSELNSVHSYFQLSMFWGGTLNINGYFKENRTISEPAVLFAKVKEANKDKLLLTFSEHLYSGSVPATTAFSISGNTISGVAIADSILTITVGTPYTCEDSVAVTYTKPVANPLQSVGGNKIASFANQHVTNELTELYGPELINQSTWYTMAYWTSVGAGWAQESTHLVKTGAAQFLRKDNFWTIGVVYKVKITIETVTAGTLNAPYNGSGTTHQYTTTGTYVYNHTCATNTAVYIYDLSWKGRITALSIKRVL